MIDPRDKLTVPVPRPDLYAKIALDSDPKEVDALKAEMKTNQSIFIKGKGTIDGSRCYYYVVKKL